MTTSPVIHALITTRAEVSGIIADLEERPRQTRADPVHNDGTLRLFDPGPDPDQIAAKKPGRLHRRLRPGGDEGHQQGGGQDGGSRGSSGDSGDIDHPGRHLLVDHRY